MDHLLAPARWIAFLRAINVGGHRVTMADLRDLFTDLGFANVATFIASGNVIFETTADDRCLLERQIEQQLGQALGYTVKTFLRRPSEVAAVAADSFVSAHVTGATLYVGFLHAEPTALAHEQVLALTTATDHFALRRREIYWQRLAASSASAISGKVLEKALGMPTTLRNITTVRKLAALDAG